jgi:hypothetical protein
MLRFYDCSVELGRLPLFVICDVHTAADAAAGGGGDDAL